MKLLYVVALAVNLVATNSQAQTGIRNKDESSDEEVALLMKPSMVHNRSQERRSFEKNTEVPALKIQNLPQTQRIFRIDAIKAVSKSIQNGAAAALKSYAIEDKSFGWQRITVPRKRRLFGDAVSVVLLRINDREKSVEIAIRGTASLDDVLHDLKAKADLDPDLGFRVHSGFRTLAREILTHLKKQNLSDEVLKSYTFSLYGHSLGGSVASLLSMYLHETGSKIAAVVTFGAPRFTTNEGTRKYQVLNQVTHRIVRCDDVVPFLPPPNFFGWSADSYQANGNIFLLLKPPYFDYSVGIDIERDFIYQLRLELENNGVTKKLAFGHRMDNYYTLLHNFVPDGLMIEAKEARVGFGYTSVPDLQPVTYTSALQSTLCPAQDASRVAGVANSTGPSRR